MAEIRRGLSVPKEVTSYFEGKSLKPAFSWLDVWGQEHAYAFTVAKATEAEVLASFHGTIAEAIRTGKGFESWKVEIQSALARQGWWGPRMVSDPTGEQPDRMVNFASDRRLKTIFWANMNAARSAGQWERAQRTKRALPYILYVRTSSGDPRPEHLGWVGIILPVDHPFWKTHWPPNGWGCKCQVRQISAREAAALLGREPAEGGVIYRDTPPDDGPDVEFRNRRTGEVTKVPQGIDPGWQTNAGLSRASTLIQNLEERLAAAPQSDATAILKDLWGDPFLQLAPGLPDQVWLPAGVSPRLAAELGAKSPVVSVTNATMAARINRHKMTMADFALLPDILLTADLMPDPRGKANVRSLIAQVGKTFWRAFVTVSGTGYLRVTSLHQRDRKSVVSEFARSKSR